MTVAALLSFCVIILPVTSENTCVNCKTVGIRLQESRFLPKVLELTCTFLPLHFFHHASKGSGKQE